MLLQPIRSVATVNTALAVLAWPAVGIYDDQPSTFEEKKVPWRIPKGCGELQPQGKAWSYAQI
jgi:hypothetical protein